MEPFDGPIDAYYMNRCLELARCAEGLTSPNPLVGAVVLNAKGQKVGEGFHAKAGTPHAEVVALQQAGEQAKGGTLYVNLEPCAHTGKTPPCTDAIIAAGIETVICGTLDPNPLVAGQGRDKLQNNRVSVREGFLKEECHRLNEVFFHYITTGLPFVSLKLAMTANGKIATRSGESKWLTGPMARQWVHHLRDRHDAVLTTSRTVIADNPRLTVREVFSKEMAVQRKAPLRVVLDRQLRLDPSLYHVYDSSLGQTCVITSHMQKNITRGAYVQVYQVGETGLGLDLQETLRLLGRNGITSVMVEAGGRLAGQLINQKLVNKFYFMYAPKIFPDAMAINSFADGVQLNVEDAPKLKLYKQYQLEEDWIVEAYPLG